MYVYKEKAEMVPKKYSEKATSPKKEKETRVVVVGALAYRKTIERRAAASTKA